MNTILEDTTKPSLGALIDRNAWMLQEALFYSSYFNKPIFPVSSKAGRKSPLISGGFKAASKDMDTVASWWTTCLSRCRASPCLENTSSLAF